MFVLPKPAELENRPTKAAELIIRLTIFGFSRLYPTYQLQAMEEIRKQVYYDVIFEPLSGESEEDCRLRTFMELFKRFHIVGQHNLYPFIVVKILKQQIKDTHESSDHRLHFAESFLGLSIIWFKGQSVNVQRLVIEELSDKVAGSISEKLNNESEEDFELRKFTELCKKVDFLTQVQFLEFVELKRPHDPTYLIHSKLLLKPQDSDTAALLLSRLSIFGFSLLSTADQQQKIQEISDEVDHHEGAIVERLPEVTEEDFRIKTFTELFNKAPVDTRIQIFRELIQQFFRQAFRHSCVPIEFLRQQKLVQNLCTTYPCGPDEPEAQKCDRKGIGLRIQLFRELIHQFFLQTFRYSSVPIEFFRQQKLVQNLCATYPCGPDKPEAQKCDRKGIGLATDDNEEMETKQSRYPEFLFGAAIAWFKTRCANHPKEPIQVLLGQVEIGDVMKKLPNETAKDFRVRRFGEWFKRLPFSSQEYFVKIIRDTMSHDLSNLDLDQKKEKKSNLYRGSYPFEIIYPLKKKRTAPLTQSHQARVTSFDTDIGRRQARLSFDRDIYYPQFIKMKTPNLKVVAAGGGATTQGGEGGGGAITQGHAWDDWTIE